MAGARGEGGSLPKHMQIAEMLVRRITAGTLRDGARLKPEREMAGELGVAVGTLRRALEDLTAKGLLERVQGSGNYVKYRPDAASIYGFFRLELPSGGGLPTARVVSAEAVARPREIATERGEAHLLRVRRVRALDGVDVALEEIWLDYPGAAKLASEALSESLYLTYASALGLTLERVEDRVGVAALPGWGAGLLQATARLGHVTRRSWAAGQVVEMSETWFDADRAQYVSRMRN